MKNWSRCFFCFSLLLASALRADAIELRAGYFFPFNSTISKVYDEGGLDLQLSSSNTLYKQLLLYESIEYMQKHGHSLNGHQSSSFHLLTLSLGLKYLFKVASHTDFYLSTGPRYFFTWVHNHSDFVDKHLKANGLGGFAGTGFLLYPCSALVIDIFAEFSYKELSFHSSKTNVIGETVQIGGIVLGLGVGYSF